MPKVIRKLINISLVELILEWYILVNVKDKRKEYCSQGDHEADNLKSTIPEGL